MVRVTPDSHPFLFLYYLLFPFDLIYPLFLAWRMNTLALAGG
jgi:hypothetical protein